MSDTLPLVSVVVPVYNRERYLGAALDSIFRQDYRPLEVLVVDDGSTDGSATVARSYPEVRYLFQTNQGVSVARNTGIAAARGEFLAFLDSDDLWTPDKLSVQIDFHVRNPEVGFTLVHMTHFLEPGCKAPPSIPPTLLTQSQAGVLPSALVARREVFDRVGVFDPTFRLSEDTDWFFRAKEARVRPAVLPQVLLHRRLHDTNLTLDLKGAVGSLMRATKASLDRTRKQQGRPG